MHCADRKETQNDRLTTSDGLRCMSLPLGIAQVWLSQVLRYTIS
jgi:hypothetical protein